MAKNTPFATPPAGWTEVPGGLTAAQLDETLKDIARPCAFSAHRQNTGAVTIASAAWTKVPGTILNNEVVDTHGAYDQANARFTVPAGEGGTYLITGVMTHKALGDGKKMVVVLYKNGAGAATLGRGTVGALDYAGFGGSVILNLAATDYVELYVYHNAVSTDIAPEDGSCHFGGVRLL